MLKKKMSYFYKSLLYLKLYFPKTVSSKNEWKLIKLSEKYGSKETKFNCFRKKKHFLKHLKSYYKYKSNFKEILHQKINKNK